jgi:hypothetical protein
MWLFDLFRLRRRRREPAAHIYFIVKGKRTMAEVLQVGQLIRPSIDIRDRFENPAAVDGVPVWTLSDPTLGILEPAADGMSAVFRARRVGTGQVNVTADANLGEGVRTITGVLDVTVLAAEAQVVRFNVPPPELDPSA